MVFLLLKKLFVLSSKCFSLSPSIATRLSHSPLSQIHTHCSSQLQFKEKSKTKGFLPPGGVLRRVAGAGTGQEQLEFERLATPVSFPRCQIRLFNKQQPEIRDQGRTGEKGVQWWPGHQGQEGHGNKGSIHLPGMSCSYERYQQ